MYWMRALGGTLYIAGMVMFGWNILKTWQARPKTYEEPVIQAPALARQSGESGRGWAAGFSTAGHRRWEGLPIVFTVWTIVAVAVASLFEILPTFLIRDNVPTIASVKPYSPLELAGRDLYQREGCFNCHSQMIRPLRYETERYGEYSKAGESVYDHPFLWGSRRIGPDLAREGGRYPNLWHVNHMKDPRAVTPKSIMPSYPGLFTNRIDFAQAESHVNTMLMLGVPYGQYAQKGSAGNAARTQAKSVADDIAANGGPSGLEDKEIVALIAYLQRLGVDIKQSSATAMQHSPLKGGF
jgi:cytochrome c oxidase cbb3-type subunit I/II